MFRIVLAKKYEQLLTDQKNYLSMQIRLGELSRWDCIPVRPILRYILFGSILVDNVKEDFINEAKGFDWNNGS